MSRQYYVYSLIDPRTMQPFYIGKGCGNRLYQHRTHAVNDSHPEHYNQQCVRIREIIADGLDVVVVKTFISTDESAVLNEEERLISSLGRVVNGTGILLNVSPGGYRSGVSVKRMKAVKQYTIQGTLISEYESAKYAADVVSSANQSYITQCCKGKQKSSGGFQWRYADDPEPGELTKAYWKKVQQLDASSNEFIGQYSNLHEAYKQTGVSVHNISECCRGNSQTAGGFKWVYG